MIILTKTNIAMKKFHPILEIWLIQGDFGTLSAQEQERQRDEWKAELGKTEEEIITLRIISDS